MNCGSENLGGYAWIPYFVEVILTGISAGDIWATKGYAFTVGGLLEEVDEWPQLRICFT